MKDHAVRRERVRLPERVAQPHVSDTPIVGRFTGKTNGLKLVSGAPNAQQVRQVWLLDYFSGKPSEIRRAALTEIH